MAQRPSATVDITWLVNDLVDRVAHVQQAVVLSHDGLLIAKSTGLSREDAEHLSAVAAGCTASPAAPAAGSAAGPVRQTIIEMEAGFLFVTAGGNGACIAVLATEDADVGLIAYEMEMLVARVGQYLSTPRAYRGDRGRRGVARTMTVPEPPEQVWVDEEAGPVVRHYAMTSGRTRPPGASST